MKVNIMSTCKMPVSMDIYCVVIIRVYHALLLLSFNPTR